MRSFYKKIYKSSKKKYVKRYVQVDDCDEPTHEYYKPLLQDIMASYSPNPSMNQQEFGQTYQYLTNYRKNILNEHSVFKDRRNSSRSWWY